MKRFSRKEILTYSNISDKEFNILSHKFLDKNFIKNKNYKAVLKEFLNILNSINYNRYFISSGSLLGLIRDNQFFTHDDDIDFETLSVDLRKNMQNLIEIFSSKGFIVRSKNYNLFPKINLYKNGCRISLGSFEIKDKKWAVSRINKIPLKFLLKTKKKKFKSFCVYVPQEPEQYLNFIYKNWKIEDRTSYYYNLQYYRHDTLQSFLYKLRRILHLIGD